MTVHIKWTNKYQCSITYEIMSQSSFDQQAVGLPPEDSQAGGTLIPILTQIG